MFEDDFGMISGPEAVGYGFLLVKLFCAGENG